MREPVRILSDLHLGHRVSRVSRVAALRPLVAGAGTVIFNGDTWQELAVPFRERAAEMLDELRAMCGEEGCDTVFLAGNHDPGWPGPGWLEMAGGRILATHGDALYFDCSPWSREAMRGQRMIEGLWAARPAAAGDVVERMVLAREIARSLVPREFPRGKTLWQRVLEAANPPGRALRIMDAWAGHPEVGAAFCERFFPLAEVLVIGHFHWPGAWLRRGRLVLNTGAWMNPCSAWCVEWQDGFLRRVKIDECGGEFRPGVIGGVWRVG